MSTAATATAATIETETKRYDNWTRPTKNLAGAVSNAFSCLHGGHNCWIEIFDNATLSSPIMKKNPALNDPFSWAASYGGMADRKQVATENFFNDTERDLTLHWTAGYVETPEIAERYRKTGVLNPVELRSAGISIPIPITLWQKLMTPPTDMIPKIVWRWSPRKYPAPEIQHWVTDESIGRVFAVVHDGTKPIHAHVIRRIAAFMDEHAETVL